MNGLSLSCAVLAVLGLMACSSGAGSPTPDISSTVDAQVEARLASMSTERDSPTAAPQATPTNAQAPMPTIAPQTVPPTIASSLPSVSFHEIWGVDESRVYQMAEGYIHEASTGNRERTWRDGEPLVLTGCRLDVPNSSEASTEVTGFLFSHDGQFNEKNYLVSVINEPSGGFMQGRCYEMVVQYISDSTECYFLGAVPSFPSAGYGQSCPTEGAKEQRVPAFMLMLQPSGDGKGTKNDRPNAKLIR